MTEGQRGAGGGGSHSSGAPSLRTSSSGMSYRSTRRASLAARAACRAEDGDREGWVASIGGLLSAAAGVELGTAGHTGDDRYVVLLTRVASSYPMNTHIRILLVHCSTLVYHFDNRNLCIGISVCDE